PAVAAVLVQEHCGLRVVRLTRPFGWDIAVRAGLDTAIGDFVAVLRADSDPPEAIRSLLEHARQGADVIHGMAHGLPPQRLLFRLCQAGFYFVGNRVLRLGLPPPSSSLFGLSRRAVNAITRIKPKHPHLAIESGTIGFSRQAFEYRKRWRDSVPTRRSLRE